MKTLKNDIRALVQAVYTQLFPEVDHQVEITPSTQAQFGHYQCNSSMKLAKPLKLSPVQISQQVVEAFAVLEHPDKDLVNHLEIKGPGFINIWLNPLVLAQRLETMFHQPKLGLSLEQPPQRIIVDFSSPNIAKEMHVGHLRSTIIGDSLCRLFEHLGHDVLRLNHLGDWGTAFGMLIAYIKQEVGVDNLREEKVTLTDLVSWYKVSKQMFDENAAFKTQSQQEVVVLQSGDITNLDLWRMICRISERAYQEVYDLLDVYLIDRGESFYNDKLKDIISILDQKGMIEISEGAKCVYLEGYNNREGEPLPFMVQKSDGGYNYATTDLAALQHRAQEEKGERLVYVTDAGQATHFDMLFKVGAKAGLYDPKKVRLDHVPFGLVLGPDGKKFKTRSGQTERLIDLLNTAVEKAKTILKEREAEKQQSFTEEEVGHIAQVLGIGAVKYADLSCNRTNDYVFSYDRMLTFEGNTAAFLLYSYVRVCGIKRKIDVSNLDFEQAKIELLEPAEEALGVHLAQWHETLESVAEDLYPNRLCDYLYQCADKFNAFFRDCRVQGHPKQNQRLKLCELTALVLATGLHLLGLKTIDRM